MIIALACLVLLVMLLGSALVVRGWRGRQIDDHPLCSGCGYDLVGSDDQTRVCPECGNDLARPGALRIGHRRRRPIAIALGALLLALAIGGGGAMLVPGVRQFDWNPYKPLWLLRLESNVEDRRRAQYAIDEILLRLENGKLTLSQVNAIVDDALRAQVRPDQAWHAWWGEFIEHPAVMQQIDAGRRDRYFIQAVQHSLDIDVPSEIAASDPVRIGLVYRPFKAGAYPSDFVLEITMQNLLLGERSTWQSGASRMGFDGSSSGRKSYSLRHGLPPGRHVARMELRIRVGTAVTADAAERAGLGLEDGWQIAESTIVLERPFVISNVGEDRGG